MPFLPPNQQRQSTEGTSTAETADNNNNDNYNDNDNDDDYYYYSTASWMARRSSTVERSRWTADVRSRRATQYYNNYYNYNYNNYYYNDYYYKYRVVDGA